MADVGINNLSLAFDLADQARLSSVSESTGKNEPDEADWAHVVRVAGWLAAS